MRLTAWTIGQRCFASRRRTSPVECCAGAACRDRDLAWRRCPPSRLLPAIAILALLFGGPVLAAEPQAVQLTESIPEQSLDSALRELARITHLQVLYVAQLTAHRRSGSHVSAGMTADEALAGMLSGTGLAYEFLNERTVKIFAPRGSRPARAAPAAAAPSP